MLDTQPSTQLPVMAFGSLASFSSGDNVDGVRLVGDVRRDNVLLAPALCRGFCGLATCLGATTTTPGSEVLALPEGVAVCDTAVPLRPHSNNEIDNTGTDRLATKRDEDLIANLPQKCWEDQFHPQTQDITAAIDFEKDSRRFSISNCDTAGVET